MSTTRTDIHRPSAPGFDPQAYTCHGVWDFGTDREPVPMAARQARLNVITGLFGQGFRFAPHTRQEHQCGHCGARLRYHAIMAHQPSRELIFVGEECLDNRFEDLTAGEFRALREAAKLNRERETKRGKLDALYAAHPMLVEITYLPNLPFPAGDFLSDVAAKILRYADPSPRQVAAVERALTKAHERAAQREAQREQEQANATAAPSGRVAFSGRVAAVKEYDGDYGVTVKMLVIVTMPGGGQWKAWGTVPRAIDGVERGQTVSLTATLTPRNDDPSFARYARPTGASVSDDDHPTVVARCGCGFPERSDTHSAGCVARR